MQTPHRRLAHPRAGRQGWSWLRAGLLALSVPLLSSAVLVYVAFVRGPTNPPCTFLKRGRQPTTRRLVVAVGASSTHASLSADYVALLRQRLGGAGYELVNAGRNGDTSGDVVGRLDEVIACDPDVVTILIGTNDVRQALANKTDPSRFRTHLEAVITRLQTETTARIALLSLPPLGEDTASETNRVVRQHNHIMRHLAHVYDLTYLPVHETLIALLAQANEHPSQPYAFHPHLLFMAAVRRHILRQSWDVIARAHGFVLLTDHIHLSDRAATVLADLVEKWLESMDVPQLEHNPADLVPLS